IDRMIEPGGILGFHAPYFAPESLDGLVAQYGLDDVLGASRSDVALMVQQLVDWNVNANALSYIVSMGPDETYNISTGEDYDLIWAQLPPAPLSYWNADAASALRNACIHLLAHHQNTWPDAVKDQVPPAVAIQTGLATNEQGQSLTGYRLASDNPLGVTYCALPASQASLAGEIDLALYSGPGPSGAAKPIVSLFNRPEGWSTLGTGSEPTRRKMQKGSMSHLFVDLLQPVQGDFVNFMGYLGLRKFGQVDEAGGVSQTPTFPVSTEPMRVSHQSATVQLINHGQNRIIVQAGSDLLYERLWSQINDRNDPKVAMLSDVKNGYVFGGSYPSGRFYMLMALRDGNGGSALLRIETLDVPQDSDVALLEQVDIACSFSLNGLGLDCL
ncbi:MAG: hypothetical protein KKF33_16655, partial [Alphaproteobacteria bacterium]|nr:hypothetical protein [Alphaproteobacteria bacterium]